MPVLNQRDVAASLLDPSVKQLFNNMTSSQNGYTALAGGGQTGATLLSQAINRVTTVATIADSALLPPAKAGMSLVVVNAGANSMNLFPSLGDAINALAANAAFAMAANKTALFFCAVDGVWNSILTA